MRWDGGIFQKLRPQMPLQYASLKPSFLYARSLFHSQSFALERWQDFAVLSPEAVFTLPSVRSLPHSMLTRNLE